MGAEFVTASNQLVVSAINGIYQGILVTFLVALGLRLLRRTNAATRHAVWMCTLVLLVLLVVAHCFLDLRASARERGEITQVETPGERTIVSSQLTVVPRTGHEPAEMESFEAKLLDYQSAGLMLSPTVELADVSARSTGSAIPLPPNSGEMSHTTGFGPDAISSGADRSAWFPGLMQRLVNPIPLTLALESRAARIAGVIVLGACLTMASVKVLILLMRLHQIRRLKARSLPASASMNDLFQSLITGLGIRRKVDLKTSPSHSSLLLGFMNPVILLPTDGRMDAREAEQILRHELAHAQRGDDWANLVQHCILAAFPFHPAAWWVSRQLSLEREIACDDHVLQASRQPQAYALLLANLAARMQRCPPVLAPGASHHKTQLIQRIDMILDTHRNTSPRLAARWFAFIASATAIVSVAAICSAPRIVLAQSESTPAAANASSDRIPAGAPGLAAVQGEAGAAVFTSVAITSESEGAMPAAVQGSATISAGPKFKPGDSRAVKLPVVVAASPAPAAPVAVIAAPQPRAFVSVGAVPVSEPKPGRTPRPPRAEPADASLEERLERLERMVESLVGRGHATGSPFPLKPSADWNAMVDRNEIARIEAHARQQADFARKHQLDSNEIEKIKEHARHGAARAAEQARQVAQNAEKIARTEPKRQAQRDLKVGSQKQLDELRKQLELLEREREKLDRQIEQIERSQEQLELQSDEELDSSFDPSASNSDLVGSTRR